MPDVRVLGVRVDRVGRAALEESIISSARNGECKVYSYVNIHAINIAQSDLRFREIVNGSAVTYCDGEGVRLGARLLGTSLPPRTVLTFWVWDLCRLLEEKGLSVYFLGGTQDVVRAAVDTLQKVCPALSIKGWHHGYFEKDGEESRRVVEEINRVRPDVLFVSFGMPAQEYWIENNRQALHAGVILPAGSMIDYVAGARKTAPAWMANNGLEWLYRLVREPRRLWRRYLIGNPLFLMRVLFQRIRQKGN